MAIKFADQAPGQPRKPAPASEAQPSEAKAVGQARFATPVEALTPVNPESASELPFTDLPAAEKKKRRRQT